MCNVPHFRPTANTTSPPTLASSLSLETNQSQYQHTLASLASVFLSLVKSEDIDVICIETLRDQSTWEGTALAYLLDC